MDQKRSPRRQKDKLGDSRDEMNLVEFSYFTLSKRAPRGVAAIEFTDELCHAGERVRRTVSIAGDPKYGLPTAREEEVVLALLALSKDEEFLCPRVEFSQAELLSLLGWGQASSAYKRLERSFFTLNGTRYRVEGWRDNKEKIYTTKGAFSLIGDFELCDSRRRVGVGSRKQRFVRDRTTSFVYWGPVLFESFQSGYIKKLDFAAVRSLRHTAAKRLYRYLDKYFNPPAVAKLCFDLNELAYLRVGIRQSADHAVIRRELEPAIAELETLGFIEPAPWKTRCRKVKAGVYELSFEYQAKRQSTKPESAEIEKFLVECGVEPGFGRATYAGNLVRDFPVQKVRRCIEHWRQENSRLSATGDKLLTPGYLIASIQSDNEGGFVPEGFGGGHSNPEQERTEQANEQQTEMKRRQQESKKAEARRARVDRNLAGKTDAEREILWAEALAAASEDTRRHFEKCLQMGAFVDEARYAVLDEYLARRKSKPTSNAA